MLSPTDYNNAVPQFLNGDYAGSAISPDYIEPPSATNYRRGTEPFETLPAQWWNWFGNQFTARFNKLNIYVKNIFNELAQLLSLVDMSPDGTELNPTSTQLKTAFRTEYPKYLALSMYPVGSLYWTSKAPEDGGDPNELFGGTWVQIKDCFVWAKGDNDTVNATGGAKTVTLGTANLPSHSHTIGGYVGGPVTNDSNHSAYTSTGGMSGNSTGTITGGKYPLFPGASSDSSNPTRTGNITLGTGSYTSDFQLRNQTLTHIKTVTVTVSHTHSHNHVHSLPANTGSTGSGTAVNVMNPYVVKYCWERTE